MTVTYNGGRELSTSSHSPITGFTRRNYGPQFTATNHTDKPLWINVVTEHREARGWISDTNLPVGINLPPHESGNCFADINVKNPWRVHVIICSDVRDQVGFMPRLRSLFLMRRMHRLGLLGLPGAAKTDVLFSPSGEFYIAGPTPPLESSER
jgi:hypothetical protein